LYYLEGPVDGLFLLGSRLKAQRLQRNETQKLFAARIGVSVPTLGKMERGDSSVAMGHWVSALRVLGREDDLRYLLAPREDLFTQYEKQQQLDKRQRASRNRP
jgi:transcriptional regulator with XRE-family HTH domain